MLYGGPPASCTTIHCLQHNADNTGLQILTKIHTLHVCIFQDQSMTYNKLDLGMWLCNMTRSVLLSDMSASSHYLLSPMLTCLITTQLWSCYITTNPNPICCMLEYTNNIHIVCILVNIWSPVLSALCCRQCIVVQEAGGPP